MSNQSMPTPPVPPETDEAEAKEPEIPPTIQSDGADEETGDEAGSQDDSEYVVTANPLCPETPKEKKRPASKRALCIGLFVAMILIGGFLAAGLLGDRGSDESLPPSNNNMTLSIDDGSNDNTTLSNDGGS